MTADDFYLDVKGDTVEIIAKDCSMKVEMEIYYEDFIDALNACVNDDSLSDWIVDTLKDAVENRWKLGIISDDEKNITLAVLEATRI